MKKIFALLLLLLIPLTGCTGQTAPGSMGTDSPYPVGDIRIGSDSLLDYHVVLPQDPDPSEVYAAETLIKYITLATGRKLTLAADAENAIYVGGYPDDALGNDGFDIRVAEGDLILSGNTVRGTYYAVITFLENYLGCRWYTADCQRILPSPAVTLPEDLNDRQIPVFTMRKTNMFSVYKNPEFASRLKLNVLMPTENQPAQQPMYTFENYAGKFVHTLVNLVPWETYYAAHPEYFSGTADDYQLCMTNPEVLQIAIASARKILEKTPDATILSVSLNDNRNSCTCPNCAKIDQEEGSQAGSTLRFVNAVAEALSQDYPNLIIDTLAYQQTLVPPKYTRPAESVQIRICPIKACAYHNMEDPNCPKNVEHLAAFRAWTEVYDDLAIWDYSVNYHGYNDAYPDFQSIYHNMQLYASSGVKNIFYEGTTRESGEFGQLRAYVLSKLMWDPYMSLEEYQGHINDFLEGYYGPGWEHVRYYLDLVHRRMGESGRHVSCQGTYDIDLGLNQADIYTVKQGWQEAVKLADLAQKEHLDRTYTSVLMADWVQHKENYNDDHPVYRELAAHATKYNFARAKGKQW